MYAGVVLTTKEEMMTIEQKFIEAMKYHGFTATIEYDGTDGGEPVWDVTAVRDDGKQFSTGYTGDITEWMDFETGFEVQLMGDDPSEDVKVFLKL